MAPGQMFVLPPSQRPLIEGSITSISNGFPPLGDVKSVHAFASRGFVSVSWAFLLTISSVV